ncbi:hypothetical protein LXL04_006398 [Taraxacum kok-saghyz]
MIPKALFPMSRSLEHLDRLSTGTTSGSDALVVDDVEKGSGKHLLSNPLGLKRKQEDHGSSLKRLKVNCSSGKVFNKKKSFELIKVI